MLEKGAVIEQLPQPDGQVGSGRRPEYPAPFQRLPPKAGHLHHVQIKGLPPAAVSLVRRVVRSEQAQPGLLFQRIDLVGDGGLVVNSRSAAGAEIQLLCYGNKKHSNW